MAVQRRSARKRWINSSFCANKYDRSRIKALFDKAMLSNFEGKPRAAYDCLARLRTLLPGADVLAREWLFTVIYYQGVTALRCGETENCLHCRGESACILPIRAAAVHSDPRGSKQAVQHFTEYLDRFPDDRMVRWLLNVAHMTLGEYPNKVDPQYLVQPWTAISIPRPTSDGSETLATSQALATVSTCPAAPSWTTSTTTACSTSS